MTKFISIWKTSNQILPIDNDTKVKQVYVWMFTEDEKFALVSKNEVEWQFPGGKPDANETPVETAVREVNEEVGFDITPYTDSQEFFGYYLVYEFDLETNKIIDSFLQLRYKLNLPLKHTELKLRPNEERTVQDQNEMIKVAKFFTIPEALEKIEWLGRSEEYKACLGA